MNKAKKLTLSLIATCALLAVFGSAISITPSMAQSEQATCSEEFSEYLDIRGKELLDFMSTHFQHPAATTALVPSAMEKYYAYQKMIQAKLKILKRQPTSEKDQILRLDELAKCDKELSTHLVSMEIVINDHIRRNTSAKRSFIMIDQYKAINNKMNKLNRSVAQMKGYFDVFDSKMPGFVPKCVKQ